MIDKCKIKYENNRDKVENLEKTGNNSMWAKSSEAEILGAKRREKNNHTKELKIQEKNKKHIIKMKHDFMDMIKKVF